MDELDILSQLTGLGTVGLFLIYLIHAKYQADKKFLKLNDDTHAIQNAMRESMDKLSDAMDENTRVLGELGNQVLENNRIANEIKNQQQLTMAMRVGRAKTSTEIPTPKPKRKK